MLFTLKNIDGKKQKVADKIIDIKSLFNWLKKYNQLHSKFFVENGYTFFARGLADELDYIPKEELPKRVLELVNRLERHLRSYKKFAILETE